jgi:large-conductance mechanosensitive channel
LGVYAHCAVRIGQKTMLKVGKIIFSVFEGARIDFIIIAYCIFIRYVEVVGKA